MLCAAVGVMLEGGGSAGSTGRAWKSISSLFCPGGIGTKTWFEPRMPRCRLAVSALTMPGNAVSASCCTSRVIVAETRTPASGGAPRRAASGAMTASTSAAKPPSNMVSASSMTRYWTSPMERLPSRICAITCCGVDTMTSTGCESARFCRLGLHSTGGDRASCGRGPLQSAQRSEHDLAGAMSACWRGVCVAQVRWLMRWGGGRASRGYALAGETRSPAAAASCIADIEVELWLPGAWLCEGKGTCDVACGCRM